MTLTILVIPDPNDFFRESTNSHNQLDFGDLEAEEWEAIFYYVLHGPVAIDESDLLNENEEEWQERFSWKFQEAIPEFPKLAEIWNPSFYISYEPDEVEQLRDECLKIKVAASNGKVLSGLKKLIAACEEASRLSYGLLLVPD